MECQSAPSFDPRIGFRHLCHTTLRNLG
jgi:hypothetical protein